MSETISDASHRAPGATDFRLMVQLPLGVRGMLTMSNSTLRQSGCRSSALATRHLISSRVAGVLTEYRSKYIWCPPVCDRPAVAASHPQGLLLAPIWLTAG